MDVQDALIALEVAAYQKLFNFSLAVLAAPHELHIVQRLSGICWFWLWATFP
jgi:hypothetical protein